MAGSDTAERAPVASPHLLDTASVLTALDVDADAGLTTSAVAERRAWYGPNELRSAPPVPLWRRVLDQFADPLVALLLVAVAISLVAWVVEGAHGVPIDVAVIAVILIANAVIGLVQQAKAADAVAALAVLTAANSTVLRDGVVTTVHSSDLVPGDVLLLAEGDAVGADARLLEATGLKLLESSLTGESEATVKDPAPLTGEVALGDRACMVHKGTAVVEGVGRAVVTATGMSTEMGAIAELLDAAQDDPSPLQVELARVSKTLGLLVIGIAVVVMAAMWLVIGADTTAERITIALTGVSLAVAAVPEGLVAILSLVLAIGVRAMARRNAVMKRLTSVETLGSASVICSDKTGTLTRNEMTLRVVQTASGRVDLTGTGYDPAGSATVTGGEPALAEARAVLVGGAVANNAHLTRRDGTWQVQGDPTEAAFLVAQHKLAEVAERAARYTRHGEVPFTSDRKLMSVIGHHADREEHRLYTKGAPDVLLGRCVAHRVGERVEGLDDASRAEITATIERLSSLGYRTLAVAYRTLAQHERVAHPDPDVERDLTFAGVVGIIDPPREEARVAIAEARRAGVRVVMITGDHPATARRIGDDLGIGEGRALTGVELDALGENGFGAAVRNAAVFARVAPRHKLAIVDALQADGHVVAMTGDGVNDAPALKSADIGVAMGITGTEVSKDAADMILADDNFATIVAAVRQGRVIFANITTFLRYLLSSNVGEVITVFTGTVLASVLGLVGPDGAAVVPLLATQILWINLVTDSAPALALGVDPQIDDVMARPPRRRDAPILDRATWLRIAWVGAVMAAVSLAAMDLYLPGGLLPGGWGAALGGSGELEAARTALFTTLVLAQLVNAFCARSATSSAVRGLFVNPWLWGSVGLGVVLQVAVVHLPPLQRAFGTQALTAAQWGVCLALASVVLWVQEVVKVVARRARWGDEVRPRPASARRGRPG